MTRVNAARKRAQASAQKEQNYTESTSLNNESASLRLRQDSEEENSKQKGSTSASENSDELSRLKKRCSGLEQLIRTLIKQNVYLHDSINSNSTKVATSSSSDHDNDNVDITPSSDEGQIDKVVSQFENLNVYKTVEELELVRKSLTWLMALKIQQKQEQQRRLKEFTYSSDSKNVMDEMFQKILQRRSEVANSATLKVHDDSMERLLINPLAPVAGKTLIIAYDAGHMQSIGHRSAYGCLDFVVGFNDWKLSQTIISVGLPRQISAVSKYDFDGTSVALSTLESKEWWYIGTIIVPHDAFSMEIIVRDSENNVIIDNNFNNRFVFEVEQSPGPGAFFEEEDQRNERHSVHNVAIVDEENDKIVRDGLLRLNPLLKMLRDEYISEDTYEARDVESKRDRLKEGITFVDQDMVEHIFRVIKLDSAFDMNDTIEAGDEIVVFYNRDSGPLRNDESIVCRYDFDAWTFGDAFEIKMSKVEDVVPHSLGSGIWYCCSFTVPETAAFSLDMVFADEAMSVFDNNNAEDYHVPIRQNLSFDERVQRTLDCIQHER